MRSPGENIFAYIIIKKYYASLSDDKKGILVDAM